MNATVTNLLDQCHRVPCHGAILANQPQRVVCLALTAFIWPWLLALGLLLPNPARAQVVFDHWVGPEAQCDYPTIQEALIDIFDCSPFICAPGDYKIRLSANYVHSGQIQIEDTVEIIGGQGGVCGTSVFGPRALLGDAPENTSLVMIDPGSGAVDVQLTSLTLEGSGGPLPILSGLLGGLIRMQAGPSSLTLRNTIVRDGRAVQGGAIHMAGAGNQLILNDGFIQTSQAIQGGGIFCTDGGVVDFQRGRIEDNTAELAGGGVFLDNGCLLRGRTAGSPVALANRSIQRNRVDNLQQGQGAGLYARASSIELGALYSFTEIKDNIVAAFVQTGEIQGVPPEPPIPIFDHYRYDLPGQNRGGGVHLEHSDGTFLNTRFVRNEASNGGALSVVGNSTLLVDRSSGPCSHNPVDSCSLFLGNRARGGRDGPGDEADEAGDGAVLISDGPLPNLTIKRSIWTENVAGCFEADASDFEGECDLGGDTDSSHASLLLGKAQVLGNLIVANDLGDLNDCGFASDFCFKAGFYFLGIGGIGFGTYAENTIVDNNAPADGIWGQTWVDNRLWNNVIWEPNAKLAVGSAASCNLSNFADELNDRGIVGPAILNSDQDPLLSGPGGFGYSPQIPDSPAIDRCDDADGMVTLTYDILGNPRPMNVIALSNGPGLRDVGAIEAIPLEGVPDNTADLAIDIRSDLPRTAPIGVAHEFLIKVTNTGRNSVEALSVGLEFESVDAVVESLQGQVVSDGAGGLVQNWDCTSGPFVGCTYVGGALNIGSSTPPVIARIGHDSEGKKSITATVSMDDIALIDLSAANDTDADIVTVGPGSDLALDLSLAQSAQVLPGEFAQLTLWLHNNGPEVANGVQVQLTASDGNTLLGNFDAPGWACLEDSVVRLVTCSLQRSLDTLQNEGGLPETFSFGATGPSFGPAFLPLVRSVIATASASNPADPELANNTDQKTFVMLNLLLSDGFEGQAVEPLGPG